MEEIAIDFQQPEDGYGWIEAPRDIPKKERLVVTAERFSGGTHSHFGLYTNVPLLNRKTLEDENGTVWYHVQTHRMKKNETEAGGFILFVIPPQLYRKLAGPIPKGSYIEWRLFSEKSEDPDTWFTQAGITLQFVD